MRLPSLPHDTLDADARRVWDSVTGGRRAGAGLVGADGSLAGPFNAMLYTPAIGERYAALGEAIRFDAILDDRLREIATLVVGAFWRSDFEWAAHAALARRAGVRDDVIDAIARGEDPVFADPRAAIAHRFTAELLRGDVPDDTYAEAVRLLTEREIAELAMVVGYYCLICLTLNAFRVPGPAGSAAPWPAR